MATPIVSMTLNTCTFSTSYILVDTFYYTILQVCQCIIISVQTYVQGTSTPSPTTQFMCRQVTVQVAMYTSAVAQEVAV